MFQLRLFAAGAGLSNQIPPEQQGSGIFLHFPLAGKRASASESCTYFNPLPRSHICQIPLYLSSHRSRQRRYSCETSVSTPPHPQGRGRPPLHQPAGCHIPRLRAERNRPARCLPHKSSAFGAAWLCELRNRRRASQDCGALCPGPALQAQGAPPLRSRTRQTRLCLLERRRAQRSHQPARTCRF